LKFGASPYFAPGRPYTMPERRNGAAAPDTERSDTDGRRAEPRCRVRLLGSVSHDKHQTLATDGGCRIKGSVRAGQWNAGVPRNFIEGRREQGFLLPPDVREWLPADHLAWFVIDAVAEMELSAFYAAYRADGHGRAAYEPSLVVALVLFAFATNVRSSRAIERHCRQDVAFRVITGNLVPDHATIARFICRHEQALADLFGDVLRLCDRAGLVKPGVVSIDGTRIAGNASPEVNHTFEQIAREILAEAKATDEAEDELYGEQRGDELPEELRTAEGRREFFGRARQELKGRARGL
jgi:transposase